jgi:hypothetical protein
MKKLFFALMLSVLLSLPAIFSFSDDVFLMTGSEELNKALNHKTTFDVSEMPLQDALKKFAGENKIRINITEGVENSPVTIKAEKCTVKEALRKIKEACGHEMLAGNLNITVLGPESLKDVQERERLLELSMEGGEKRDLEIEETVRQYLGSIGTEKQYVFADRLIFLNNPDYAVQILFREFDPGATEKSLRRVEAIGFFMGPYAQIEKSGIVEDRYYLSGKRYLVKLDPESLRSAREKCYEVLQSCLEAASEKIVHAALRNLALIRTQESLSLLKKSLENKTLQLYAAYVLATMGDASGMTIMKEGLEIDNISARLYSAEGLWLLNDRSGMDALIGLLERKDLDNESLKNVISLLSEIKDKKCVPVLIGQLKGPCGREALVALEAIMNKKAKNSYDLKDPEAADKVTRMWMKIWKQHLQESPVLDAGR